MITEKCVRDSFAEQAGYCKILGSSFMSDLLTGLGKQLDKSTETGRRVLQWSGDPAHKADALALRLAGALHALARSGQDQALAKFYHNPELSSDAEFIPAVLSAIAANDDELYQWLEFAPQTNEVARASIIYSGLSVIAKRFGLPLSLYEMGCSGGLNLQCAQFGYQFKGVEFGDNASILQLSPDWSGELPPDANVEILSRQGCDLNPLSVMDADDAAKLVAYLWPDQPLRIARVEAAIAIAKNDPPKLEKADAAAWVEDRFQADGAKGNVRVLYDTIAWNYFPDPVKDRIDQHMHEVGSAANADNPIAWLTFEFDEEDKGPFLKLRTWPGGGQAEILASADPHVNKIHWLQEN
ncbi:MAG: DUF2332 family protein [Rhizobiaceae bacterium]|nr:DUF2332 family protein [Rhizobiaceae bacterium]